MSRRFKEEERIERIIRGLLKQPENRRCINCNSLGPQYVCTTFWTFVCTNCSGVHREFTHRVKSVSMARFNAEEVSALQAGGNERAKEIYFKAWDPQRNTLPDGSNLHRLRDFIKHVYVDRRYTGERTYDKLPTVKVGSKEDTYDRQSFERFNDERSLRYYIDDRSPQHRPQSARAGGYKNRSARFEIVDDRFRDDAPGSGRLSRRSSNVESTAGSLSPDPRKIGEMTVSPVIQNVKDNTSENVSTPRVTERPKENGDVAGSAHALKPTSNNSQRSVETKGVERKLEKSSSLIDSSNSPQPSDKARQAQTQDTPSSTGGGNSYVQSSTIKKASSVPTMNFLETLLFELSVPPVVPSCTISEAPSSGDAPVAVHVATSNSVGTTVAAPGTNTEAVPSSRGGAEASTAENAQASIDEQHLPTSQQHQPSAYAAVDDSSTVQQSNSSIEHNNQPWTSSPSHAQVPPPNAATGQSSFFDVIAGPVSSQPWTSSPSQDAQVPPPSAASEQSSQGASKLSQDTGLTDGSKSIGRKELPADLFTFSYPSHPAPVPSWQYHPSQRMGFNMQYNPAAVLMNAFPNLARSRNPFDIGDDDTSQVRAPVFPSMSSMQGALPQVHTCLQPQSSPYPSTMPPQSPSYGMTVSSGPYMGQQPPNNMPPSSRPQGGRSSFGSGTTDAFASLNPIISQTTPNSHSPSNSVTPASPIGGGQGGNPFG
ncbi:hypothetical protein LguiA_036418 [Lonicera macranthoides]